MYVAVVTVLLVTACGASSSSSTPTPPSSTPTAPSATSPTPPIAPTDATASPVAEPAPPPSRPRAKVTFEALLTAGPGTREGVNARLMNAHDALLHCNDQLDGSVVLELKFAIASEGVVPKIATTASEPLLRCVSRAFGTTEQATPTGGDPTHVYVQLVFEVDGQAAPPRPSVPDLRTDFEHACSMFARSGAMAEPDLAKRPQMAQDYFRAHVRHPALYRMAWLISVGNPADRKRPQTELKNQIKPAVKCADTGW